MFRSIKYIFMLFVIFSLSVNLTFAEDETVDEEATVESEEKMEKEAMEQVVPEKEKTEENAMPDNLPPPNAFCKAKMIFTDPSIGKPSGKDDSTFSVPVGRPVYVLIGFTNAAVPTKEESKSDMVLDAVEAAIRYPMDYSYYIQNFTRIKLNQVVEPMKQASVLYAFQPHQQLTDRAYGLTIRIYYHNADTMNLHVHTVFNQTVQMAEFHDGAYVDHEGIFLTVVVGCLVILGLFGVYQLFLSYAPKRFRQRSSKSSKTNGFSSYDGDSNIDLDWIPKEHLRVNRVRQTSPRQRKVQKSDESE